MLRKYEDDVRAGRTFLDDMSTLQTPEARRNYEQKIRSMRVLQDLRKLKEQPL
jgi:hypothetical protein